MTSLPLHPVLGWNVTRWIKGGNMNANAELLTAPINDTNTLMLGMAADNETETNRFNNS